MITNIHFSWAFAHLFYIRNSLVIIRMVFNIIIMSFAMQNPPYLFFLGLFKPKTIEGLFQNSNNWNVVIVVDKYSHGQKIFMMIEILSKK